MQKTLGSLVFAGGTLVASPLAAAPPATEPTADAKSPVAVHPRFRRR
jgi:hypothetical protein